MRRVDRKWLDTEATSRHIGKPSWLCPVLQAHDKTARKTSFPEPWNGNRSSRRVARPLGRQLIERPLGGGLVAVMIKERLRTLDIGKSHRPVVVKAQKFEHPGHVIVALSPAVVTVDERLLYESTLKRQGRRQIDDVPDKLWSRISRTGDFQAATGVSHEHVTRLEQREDRIKPTRHCRFFVHALAVAWYVDCDRFVTEGFKLRNCPAPTPGTVESTVNQDEAHVPIFS